MPLYDYLCSCGAQTEAFRAVKDRNDAPPCRLCNGKTEKVISSYSAIGDLEPYYDDNLETYIKSKRHRKVVMREKDVYERFGRGWK